MNRVLTILLLTLSFTKMCGQKLRGIYVGEIVSSGNVLVLNNNGPEVTGSLHVNKTEMMEFSGTYNNHTLRGFIRLSGGEIVGLEGRSENNFISMVLSTDSAAKRQPRKLYKISTNSNSNIDGLFSDINDLLLLGKWETITDKRIAGEPFDGKFSWEFESNGKLYQRNIVLPSKEFSYPPDFDPHKTVELSWATDNGELTILWPSGLVKLGIRYRVSEDTLVLIAPTGRPLSYYIRK